MTLGFKQKFPWATKKEPAPTNFREKILSGVQIRTNSYTIPKLHTFREDKHDRWKAGNKIEMVYRGAGYSILDHFNKDISKLSKCVSTQKIKIEWIPVSGSQLVLSVRIDGRIITDIDTLVVNDGFSSKKDFMKWFKEPFEGKIIHWTDLRY